MLYIKKSTLPNCGLGLFTSVDIKKGEFIVEYKGDIYTWKKCIKRAAEEDKAGYVFYINKNYCIDAYDFPLELARYGNDAEGIRRKKGVKNNSEYLVKGKRVYIVSQKKIKAHSEILVPYGKDYWDEFEESDDDN
jgi:SET domain-containing protein